MKNSRKRGSSSSNNKIVIASVAAISIAVVAAATYKFGFAQEDLYKDVPVVGTFNGEPLYLNQAQKIASVVVASPDGRPVDFNTLDADKKLIVLKEVAAQKAMLNEAKLKGIEEDLEIKRNVAEYREKLIRDKVLKKIAKTEVTDEKVLEQYKEIEKALEGKTQMKVSHILLDSKDDANDAKRALRRKSFSKVAKEFSQDSTTKDRGGDLGYVLTGIIDPDFEKAALALKVGGVSKPVKTKFGWHIIKLEEKQKAEVPSYDALKNKIANDIYAVALKNYANKILDGAEIEIKEEEVSLADEQTSNDNVEDLSKIEPAADKEKAQEADKK